MSAFTIHVGDCRDVMASMDAASVDAVVCDPPYGLTANKKGGSGAASLNTKSPAGRSRIGTGGGFMGQQWDAAVPDVSYWIECWRVLKPGAHLLAFGGTRTFHRLTCAIEDADFEIRDVLSWLYGSGFPKSLNVGDGRGTALKPAWEPIILARKPLAGTVAANVQEHGTGALNVDGCRIGTEQTVTHHTKRPAGDAVVGRGARATGSTSINAGRWPANVLLNEEAATMLDEQSGVSTSKSAPRGGTSPNPMSWGTPRRDGNAQAGHNDTGGASRFFYTAKASRGDRGKGNTHPTVKPVDLMRWLVRLVTPAGGTVLDPYMGSGTTGVACTAEGFPFVGIELSPEYAAIARTRIANSQPTLFGGAA